MLRTVKYLSLLVVQFIGALLGVGALFLHFTPFPRRCPNLKARVGVSWAWPSPAG